MSRTLALRDTDHGKVISCLLALEIADYEAKPIFDQVRLTHEFHSLLHESKIGVSTDECVSVVGEEKALVGFFAATQECLATALMIREAMLTQDRYRDLLLRIGINLDQAEVATDEFGNPQVSGEARRNADRFMRLGPPLQISVSPRFVEVLSRDAPELANLLEYQVLSSDPLGPLSYYRISPPQTQSEDPTGTRLLPGADSSPIQPPFTATIRPQATAKQGNELSRLLLGCVLLSFLAGAAVVALLDRWNVHAPSPRIAASTPPIVPNPPIALHPPVESEETTDSAVAKPIAALSERNRPRPVKSSPVAPITKIAQYAAPAEQEAPTASNEASPSTQPAESAQINEPAIPSETTAPIQDARSGTVFLVVKPWGEVYVDGRQVGITPPLKSFDLPPGLHVITVTNSSLPSYQREVNVQPETTITVAHDFTCKWTRCPGGFGKGPEFDSRLSSETADADFLSKPSRQ
jgi:hypothetical protein